jgi:hypothetical protein
VGEEGNDGSCYVVVGRYNRVGNLDFFSRVDNKHLRALGHIVMYMSWIIVGTPFLAGV